jgi:hypothetical protein
MHTKFWSKNVVEIDHLKDLGIDGRVIFLHVVKFP